MKVKEFCLLKALIIVGIFVYIDLGMFNHKRKFSDSLSFSSEKNSFFYFLSPTEVKYILSLQRPSHLLSK